jgi:polyisoprenoid-binding protein YceI
MRKLAGQKLIGLVLISICWCASAVAAPKTYSLDGDHTTVAFLVDHIGFSRMLGRFTDVQGSFVYDAETNTLSDLKVVVKTASVASDHKRRDAHVRSKDFLSAEEHPEMIFTANGGKPSSATSGVVDGELLLRGETHPLSLDVTLNKHAKYPFGHKKPTLGISARGSVERAQWGMTYGVANSIVGGTVDIIIETEAIEQN